MTIVNQEELRDFLSVVFGIDKKYIIPKQGNWYNPQSLLSSTDKPMTWLGYRIKGNEPITTNFFVNEEEVIDDETVYTQYICSYMVAQIELQFIGKRAEEYANSVQFFSERQDVTDELLDCEGVIMKTDFRVYSLDYFQDGLNNILSWNVNFKIEWTKKQLVNQGIAQGVDFIGGIVNE